MNVLVSQFLFEGAEYERRIDQIGGKHRPDVLHMMASWHKHNGRIVRIDHRFEQVEQYGEFVGETAANVDCTQVLRQLTLDVQANELRLVEASACKVDQLLRQGGREEQRLLVLRQPV